MNTIQNTYIPYLQKGYSTATVQNLLYEMKIFEPSDHDTIYNTAIAVLKKQSQDIKTRNANRFFIVKVLDTVLWALSFGYLRLLEKEINIDPLIQTANKIRDYVNNTPLVNQTMRPDYQQAMDNINKKKLRLEKEREKQRLKLARPLSVKDAHLVQKGSKCIKTDEELEVKILKEGWNDDVSQEVMRLQAKQLTIPHDVSHYNMQNPQAKMIVGRIREFKEQYRKSHYVFTHGQGTGLSVINECMKYLLKAFTPDLSNPLSMPFRQLYSIEETANITAFFKKYENHPNPQFNINSYSFNDDMLNKETGELLSVDAYMWSTAGSESALDFFLRGTNINTGMDPTIVKKIFNKVLSHYFINFRSGEAVGDQILCKAIAEKAEKISYAKAKATTIGTLWAICVPKDVLQDPKRNFAYRSHAYGRPCKCYHTSSDINVLEKAQEDVRHACNPQWRLLMCRVDNEKGVRAFPVNSLTKMQNKQFSRQIKNLIREAAFYSNILGLTGILTPKDSEALIQELKELVGLKQIESDILNYLLTIQQDLLTPELKNAMTDTAHSLAPKH